MQAQMLGKNAMILVVVVITIQGFFCIDKVSGDTTNSRHGGPSVPSWCQQDRYPFARRNEALLADMNINRAQVWRHPIETYGKPLGYGGFYYPLGPVYEYYSDHYYDERTCSFMYIQLFPTIMPDGKRAMKIQSVAARVDPPSREGPNIPYVQTYTNVWLTPPVWSSVAIANPVNKFAQVALHGRDVIFSVANPSGKIIMDEERSIVVPNVERAYSLMLYLDDIPLGLETSALWLFWNSTIVTSPNSDITSALAAFYAGQVPLLPDPDVPPGVPGVLPVHIYIPPGQNTRSVSSNESSVSFPTSVSQVEALLNRFPFPPPRF